jgi:pimeloyl-ACP methyl ester carboxylesterase
MTMRRVPAAFLHAALALLAASTARAQPDGGAPLAPLGIALESLPYPHPVRFLPLSIDGQDVRMAYMDIRPTQASDGRAVVLMHGKNFGGYYWANLIPALAAAGYRVVVPDQIGWGKSSKPEIRYRFPLLAANTARLLDTLKIGNVAVIGHSTGGMLAARFALMYPDRVTRLVLEDPVGLEDYRIKVPPQSDETLYRAELANTDPGKIRAFYARYFAHPKPEVYGPLADVQIRVTLSGEYARWAKASALAYQMIYDQPVIYEYGLLKPPTLLIAGEQDRAAPLSAYAGAETRKTMGHVAAMARQAVKQIPRGSLLVIPECGHIPHLERSELFEEALLKFLRGGE